MPRRASTARNDGSRINAYNDGNDKQALPYLDFCKIQKQIHAKLQTPINL
ncbi:hypothetical protein [Helicobacter sp. T3_23-1056]